MCGIAGFIAPAIETEALRARAVAMADAIRHRGPDSDGVWLEPTLGLALAHRRLAIVDLSPGGAQPMHSGSGRFVIVFNGELFNYRQLRQELIAAGVKFRSESDTEVMLHAIECWGLERSLNRFTGQFALALWDRENRELTLARDRFGEKPLYFQADDRCVLFASELKAIAVHPGFRADIDREALASYFRLGYVSGTRSIYAAVRKVSPGSFLVFRCDAGAAPQPGEEHHYWRPADAFGWARANPFRGSFDDAVDELDSRLRKIVASRMVADVPLGAFLSGGYDSTAIVALMQTQSADPVRTFTVGFEKGGFDESEHAAVVAQRLGTRHTPLPVTAADALALVPELPRMYDEPFADSSQIPTYLVARLARREVTVALTGDGGDEVFTGYNRYFWWRYAWSHFRFLPRWLRRGLGHGIASVSAESYDRLFKTVRPMLPARLRFGNPGERLHKLAPLIEAPSAAALYESMIAQTVQVSGIMRDPPVHRPELAMLADDSSIVDYMKVVPPFWMRNSWGSHCRYLFSFGQKESKEK
jgi:asparagine synthase (glutamine-hydrolysing)